MSAPTSSQLVEADERLATIFSHFYCVQQDSNAHRLVQQLLPNYEMLLAFNFGPAISVQLDERAFKVHRTVVLGPVQTLLRYELPPGGDLIVVNFTLNGFYRLLGQPMHQFRLDEWQGANDVLNSQVFDTLWEELSHMTTLADRLQRISSYILTHLKFGRESTDTIINSVPLFNQNVVDPVKAIAADRGLSARSIQLYFQTNLGYSAKDLTRFLRFKHVMTYLIQRAPNAVDWPGIVDQFGYHDQSHLIRDFRHFLGMTPRQFSQQVRQGAVCVSKAGKIY
ncbi:MULTISPECIES: helix-turn-helix domain-containing protein [unclassified Spirosoma]|uniref:helix-turn-helix domain-containing protein n=1 Tax=unclassified Spirosoma TaxID=2621999 RepID=UPI00095CB104|nr:MULTISPECIES: helix-turn-helix domain-containing protein [unclassified Spirosoma]OJW75304.1 MAG: hypothetical protein BGO59_18690 [Spirosoma sp. 48-14]